MIQEINNIVVEVKRIPKDGMSLQEYTAVSRRNLTNLPSYQILTLDDLDILKAYNLGNLNPSNSSVELSGYPGRQVFYTYRMGNENITEMRLWTVVNNTVYTITYNADNKDRFADYFPYANQIVRSIEIGQVDKGDSHDDNSGYSKYGNQDMNFSLVYPSDWTISTESDKSGRIYLSPIVKESVLKQASHIVMSMDVDSGYDVEGEDYRAQIDWNPLTQRWNYELLESSHGGEDKILGYGEFSSMEQKDDYAGFSDVKKNFIRMSLNLSKINFPDQYNLVFFATDTYQDKNNICGTSLFDMTDEIHVPPPDFTFLTTPTSLSLRPGEVENMELQIKNNNAKLNSNVTLSTNETRGINVDFIPNTTSVPPSGLASSLMRIEADEDAMDRPYTMSIDADITFPSSLTSYLTGEAFNNTGGARIDEHSSFTVTVLPKYSDWEKFTNWVNSWISPISGLWTFLAGVAVTVTPLIIYIKKSRKDRKGQAT
jgi:hypothetical protein